MRHAHPSQTIIRDLPAELARARALEKVPPLAGRADPGGACGQAKNRGGLQHERLTKLMTHLESSAPPCMSDAPDWESSQGWLISTDAWPDSQQPPALPDPGECLFTAEDETAEVPCIGSPFGAGSPPLMPGLTAASSGHAGRGVGDGGCLLFLRAGLSLLRLPWYPCKYAEVKEQDTAGRSERPRPDMKPRAWGMVASSLSCICEPVSYLCATDSPCRDCHCAYQHAELQGQNAAGGSERPRPDMKALARAWESSQRSTRDDWAEWMRHFAVVLLQESPSSALRATCDLALVRGICFLMLSLTACCVCDQAALP